MTSAGKSAELIRALVALGKALGLAVVAEGVETREQLTSLQEIGCSTGQGLLFMPAVTGERAADLLGRSLYQSVLTDPRHSRFGSCRRMPMSSEGNPRRALQRAG